MTRLLRHRQAALLAILSTATLIGWIYLWQHAVLGLDDYKNTTRQGQYHAQTTWSSFWTDYEGDYRWVNGRAADAVVRLFMTAGEDGWRLITPVALLLVALVSTLWLPGRRAGAESDEPRLDALRNVLGMIGVFLIPFCLIAMDRPLGGDAVMTLSPAVGYLIAPGFLLLGALPLWRTPGSSRLTRWAMTCCLPFAFLAPLMHENLAIASLGMVAVAVATGRRRLLRPLPSLTAVALVLGAVTMLQAPGLAARRRVVDTLAYDIPDRDVTILRAANGLQQFQRVTALPIMAAVAICAVLVLAQALTSSSARRRERVLDATLSGLLLIGMIVWWVVVSRWEAVLAVYRSPVPPPRPTAGQLHGAMGIVALTAVIGLLALILLVLKASRFGAAPALLLVAAFGACLPPIGVGRTSDRSFASGAYLGVLLLLVVLVRAGETMPRWHRRPIPLATAGLALVLVLTLPAVALTVRTVRANHQRWLVAERQIDEARSGRRTVVELPLNYPDNRFAYRLSFGTPYLTESMRTFYGLPRTVKFVWVAK